MNITLKHFTDTWSGSLYDDWTDYLISASPIQKNIEDDTLLEAGEILIQKVNLKLFYEDDVQTTFESADEGHLHVFQLIITLPEAGTEKTVFSGALDLRTIEVDEENKLISFEIIGKLATIILKQLGAPRQQNVNVFSRVGASSTDHVYMDADLSTNEIIISVTDSGGAHKDVQGGTGYGFNGGEIFEYNDGTSKKFMVLNYRRETRTDGGTTYYVGVITPQCPDGGTSCFPSGSYEFSSSENEYELNFYGENIYLYDGTTNDVNGFNGLKMIEAYLKQIDTGASVSYNGIFSYSITRLEDFEELTLDTPDNPGDNIKNLAKTCGVWVFVDTGGNYKIWSRFSLSYGSSITINSTHILSVSPVKRYAMDIAKKITVEVDGNDGVTGSAVVYNSNFFRGEEISKTIEYQEKTTNQSTLDSEAESRANDYMDFYGLRREGKTLKIALKKDDYFDIELLDIFDSDYFINGMEIDLQNGIMQLDVIEKTGHTS